MPQGQIVLGLTYANSVTKPGMPKKSASAVADPAASETQRQAGLRIRAVRKLAGLKQEQIAPPCGADQAQWSRWERGCRLPEVLVMIRFAARAKTSLDLIYRGIPSGTDPTLRKLLQASVPELLAPDPTDTDQDTDTALASYRSSIQEDQAT